jgi:hypothetical protein
MVKADVFDAGISGIADESFRNWLSWLDRYESLLPEMQRSRKRWSIVGQSNEKDLPN